MTTHKLKLNLKDFDAINNNKKFFKIIKNDQNFEEADILELKAYGDRIGYMAFKTKTILNKNFAEVEKTAWFKVKTAKNADTFNAKILNVISADQFNQFEETKNGIPQSIKWANSYRETYIKDVHDNLIELFSTTKLPSDYVILGLEKLS